MPKVIPPSIDKDDAFFWEGVQNNKLLLRSCAKCGQITHPPVPMCGECHSVEWTVHQSSGRGTVHSWIAARHPNDREGEQRIVILVDLEEGVRFVSNLLDTPLDEVRNEMAVQVTYREIDGMLLPQFVRAGV